IQWDYPMGTFRRNAGKLQAHPVYAMQRHHGCLNTHVCIISIDLWYLRLQGHHGRQNKSNCKDFSILDMKQNVSMSLSSAAFILIEKNFIIIINVKIYMFIFILKK